MDSLLAMGFEEVTAEAALSATGGDVNAALELLLSGSDIPTQVTFRLTTTLHYIE